MAVTKETIVFEGVDKISKTTKNISAQMGGLMHIAKGVGALFLTGSVAKGFTHLINEANAAEQAAARLDIALKNMGVTSKSASTQVALLASKLQQTSGFADDKLTEAFTNLLFITEDYAVATEHLGTVSDFARAMQIDLGTAADLVGRAYRGDTAMLKKYGVVLTEGVKGMEALVKINQKFSGAGSAYLETYSGQVEKLKNDFNDLSENLGKTLIPHLQDMVNLVNSFFRTQKETDFMSKVLDIATDKFEQLGESGQRNLMILRGELLNYKNATDEGFKTVAYSKAMTAALELDNIIKGMNETIINTGGAFQITAEKMAGAFDIIGKQVEEELAYMDELIDKAQITAQFMTSMFMGLGDAIGKTAAGATDAWSDFAKSAITSILSMVQTALQANLALYIATGNVAGVAAIAAGTIALEAAKAFANNVEGGSSSSSASSGFTSSPSTGDIQAMPSGSTAGTKNQLIIQNPVLLDRQSVDRLLEIAIDNGWEFTHNNSVSLAEA